FGSISGSGVASAAAVGGTMGPMQKKEGYGEEFSAATNIASAPAGLLIPPSNTLIVYSLVSGTSIAALFVAGYIPGVLWGIATMVVVAVYAWRRKLKSQQSAGWKTNAKVLLDAVPSLMLIVIVIGGIVGGVFTATEGSAIAVVYSLLLSFLYRSIKIRDLSGILIESTKI